MGENIKVYARKKKIDFCELLEFAQKNKEKYDVWNINGECVAGKSKFLARDFNNAKHKEIHDYVTAVCDQLSYPRHLIVSDIESIELRTEREISESVGDPTTFLGEWRLKQMIELFKRKGFERKFGENPKIFWNIRK